MGERVHYMWTDGSVYTESSLESVHSAVIKKLKLNQGAKLTLVQLRDGDIIDLEDGMCFVHWELVSKTRGSNTTILLCFLYIFSLFAVSPLLYQTLADDFDALRSFAYLSGHATVRVTISDVGSTNLSPPLIQPPVRHTFYSIYTT